MFITQESIANLPEPVQRYMQFSGVIGTPWVETVRLQQTGTFRTGADRPWMPVTAEETYTTDPPGFVWNARFKMAGLPLIRARDTYAAGKGHMFGKLAGVYTLFDARGTELTQATMLRYLNEVMWFPTAFLGDNMRWEALDDRSARVTFSDGGGNVSAVLYFDPDGRLTNFEAMRYYENLGNYSLERWSTPITAYGEHSGLRLPTRGKAVWHLADCDFAYADLEITEVEYNVAL
jgi:hypothetical protein